MDERGAAKASETLAVVRWRRKQRECLHGGYVGGGQWKEEVVMAVKKSGPAAEGTGAVVLAAVTVAMTSADVIAKRGVGNGGGNRGSGGATTINQNAAAAEA